MAEGSADGATGSVRLVEQPPSPGTASIDVGDSPDRRGNAADVCVVIVVYGEEPWLEQSVHAVLASEGVSVEVLLVENGGSESTIAALELIDGVRVLRPFRNTGFAEGCNLGAAAGAAPVVALINPDAIVEPQALAALAEMALRPGVGIATGSLRLASAPDRMNSAGNDVSFLGLSWAGRFDEPASDFPDEFDVASASGAAMACTRELWNRLGGLEETFFAYFEDTEFSIRCWQAGLRVVFVPTAVVVHRYEFSRNVEKFYLLERNRLITTLTCFDSRHLAAVAPLLVLIEVALLALAAKDGWLPQKLRAYRAVLADRHAIGRRRAFVMNERTVSPRRFNDLLTTHLSPGNLPGAKPPAFVERALGHYWRIARAITRI